MKVFDVSVYDCHGMCSHEHCLVYEGDMTAEELADAQSDQRGLTVQVHGEWERT